MIIAALESLEKNINLFFEYREIGIRGLSFKEFREIITCVHDFNKHMTGSVCCYEYERNMKSFLNKYGSVKSILTKLREGDIDLISLLDKRLQDREEKAAEKIIHSVLDEKKQPRAPHKTLQWLAARTAAENNLLEKSKGDSESRPDVIDEIVKTAFSTLRRYDRNEP